MLQNSTKFSGMGCQWDLLRVCKLSPVLALGPASLPHPAAHLEGLTGQVGWPIKDMFSCAETHSLQTPNNIVLTALGFGKNVFIEQAACDGTCSPNYKWDNAASLLFWALGCLMAKTSQEYSAVVANRWTK